MKRTFNSPRWGLVKIITSKYQEGGLAIQLFTEQGPLGKLSVWVDKSSTLPPDEFFVKDWSENELFIEDAMASGWFEYVPDKIAILPNAWADCWRLRDQIGKPIIRDAETEGYANA